MTQSIKGKNKTEKLKYSLSSSRIMEDVNKRLIPYENKSDLTKRVAALLGWEGIGDPGPFLPVILSYPSGHFHRHFMEYYPSTELSDLMKHLPQEHEIIQEILRQAEENLKEVLEKTRNDLKVREPRYLNSFVSVGGSGCYKSLFDLVQQAAYHVIDLGILTDDNPPREAGIVRVATEGVTGYDKSHPEEVRKFLDHVWDKKLTLPFVVAGYLELGNERAIDVYFEIFRVARGEEHFVMNGVQRGFNFKFIGRRLKRKFTDHNFRDHYQDIEDDKLRGQLDAIFT